MADYDYPLPDGRIARFPLADRAAARLLVWRRGAIAEHRFGDLPDVLPAGAMLVFNDTRVVRARLVMHKPSGARIELFCLEPRLPADYEQAFAVRGEAEWSCIVGNLRRWKEGSLAIPFARDGGTYSLRAERLGAEQGRSHRIRFRWDAPLTFGQLLEHLGRIPIPPYLGRESEEIDNTRYQTVYARVEGSVAAPTAGLHFTAPLLASLRELGVATASVTLHVGAGTFLPVKERDAAQHTMHTEHFEVERSTLCSMAAHKGPLIAVGTTSVRTLESLPALAGRILAGDDPRLATPVGQWEPYELDERCAGRRAIEVLAGWMEREGVESLKGSTQIMITPCGFRYRLIDGMTTNFHQPGSTLLLLVAALVGEEWRTIYDYALRHDFRFLSYGDTSLLLR